MGVVNEYVAQPVSMMPLEIDRDKKQFEVSLAKIVASSKLPDDLCRSINLDNHTTLIKPDWLRRSIYSLNTSLITWYCDLHRIDLSNSYSPRRKSPAESVFDRILHNKSTRTRKRWPWFVLALYVAGCTLLSINIYYQYIYDANKARLEKLHTMELDRQMNLTRLRVELMQKISEARRVLIQMGASHLEWSFIIQIVFDIFMQAFMWFAIFPTLHYTNEWILVSTKAILNRADETSTRLKMMMNEVERFRMDGYASASMKLKRVGQDLNDVFDKTEITPRGRRKMQQIVDDTLAKMAFRARKRQAILMSRLKSVALSGRLNPLNGTPRGRDRLALACFFSSVMAILYSSTLILASYSIVRKYFEELSKRVEHRGLADALNSALLLMVWLAALISGSFWCNLMNSNFFDELDSNKHLQTLIRSVVQANRIRLGESILACERLDPMDEGAQGSRNNSWPSLVPPRHELGSRLNSWRFRLAHDVEMDLMTIILQYRLISRSATLARDPIQGIVYLLVVWALYVPAVLMLHSAYLNSDIRLRLLTLSVGGSFASVLLLAPFGLIYTRRLALFKSIWTLVGQLSYFETMPEVDSYLDLSESVSLSILRRLLGESHLLSRNLSFKIFSLPITYLNLGRLFSYILVAIIAGSMLTTRLFGDGFARIMADPFGLFDFSVNKPHRNRTVPVG